MESLGDASQEPTCRETFSVLTSGSIHGPRTCFGFCLSEYRAPAQWCCCCCTQTLRHECWAVSNWRYWMQVNVLEESASGFRNALRCRQGIDALEHIDSEPQMDHLFLHCGSVSVSKWWCGVGYGHLAWSYSTLHFHSGLKEMWLNRTCNFLRSKAEHAKASWGPLLYYL